MIGTEPLGHEPRLDRDAHDLVGLAVQLPAAEPAAVARRTGRGEHDRRRVRNRPDPGAPRARRARLTAAGWRAIDTGERVIGDFDRWLADSIGADVVVQLRNALDRIVATDPADRQR